MNYQESLTRHNYIPMIGCIQTTVSFTIQVVWLIHFVDKNIYFVFLVPLSFLFTSFFVFYTINIIYNIVSPKYWTEINSKYLSFHPKKITNPQKRNTLLNYFQSSHQINPHNQEMEIDKNAVLSLKDISKKKITVQIPVYTEDFEKVIKKTLENVLELCRYYNSQGIIKMNIFVNDDGLNVISEEEKLKRIQYYNQNPEIFYIGREKENRRGRFKKASNMNFCLNKVKYCQYLFSNDIEEQNEYYF